MLQRKNKVKALKFYLKVQKYWQQIILKISEVLMMRMVPFVVLYIYFRNIITDVEAELILTIL